MPVHSKEYGEKRGRSDGVLERGLYENGLFRTQYGLWTRAERALVLSMQVKGTRAQEAFKKAYLDAVLS